MGNLPVISVSISALSAGTDLKHIITANRPAPESAVYGSISSTSPPKDIPEEL